MADDAQKHTPGPWEVAPLSSHDPRPYVYAGQILIAKTYRNAPSLSQEIGEANARLIAAAPDGHEANKASLLVLCALRDAQPWTPPMLADIDFAINACRGALTKVKGAPLEDASDDGPDKE